MHEAGTIEKVDFIDEVLKERNHPELLLPRNAYEPLMGEERETSAKLMENIFLEYDLIIAFELSKESRSWIERINTKHLVFYIHPARFCSDWVFSVYSNDEQLASRMKEYHITIGEFKNLATYWKALINERLHELDLENDSVLLIGQLSSDMSVWDGSKMLSLYDFDEKIKEIVKTSPKVYFKSHPHGGEVSQRYASESELEFIDENIYWLLASGKIKTVYAISSSVVQEAKYFGVDSHYLWEPYFNRDGQYLSIGKYLFCSTFWTSVLRGGNRSVSHDLFFEDKAACLNRVRQGYGSYSFLYELTKIPEIIRDEPEEIPETKRAEGLFSSLRNYGSRK